MNDLIDHMPAAHDAYRNQALALLNLQKTMVLGVHADGAPWVAPVYFVFVQPGIYFFSSPRSIHIQAARSQAAAAGAIFAESDQWLQIRGLQMTGQVEEIQGPLEKLRITTRYLNKFPLARELMATEIDKIPGLAQRVGLYVFWPAQVYCTDNREGFGRRVQVQLW
jgi:uncharacterized protein YhbP (UPF0306 family)